MSEETVSFEEFNRHIDESHDEGCSMCFSFHHFKYLNPTNRKIAWLGWEGKEQERQQLLDSELERLAKEPVDDQIHWLVLQAELLETQDLALRDRIMNRVLSRAYEMTAKKMKGAWTAVRTYAWMKDSDPGALVCFLEKTDDLDVWQVVFQCIRNDTPHYLGKHSLSLSFVKKVVYQYLNQVLKMGDEVKPYVVAVNGVQAMCALQHPQVLEMFDKLPKHHLDKNLLEHAQRQIAYLRKVGDLEFISTLEQIKDRKQL